MIKIKTDKEIELMRKAGEITKNTLLEVEKYIKPGVTTKFLDKIAYDFIKKNNATPSFLHYGGFPATICASKNDVVVHGFPDDVPLEEGEHDVKLVYEMPGKKVGVMLSLAAILLWIVRWRFVT